MWFLGLLPLAFAWVTEPEAKPFLFEKFSDDTWQEKWSVSRVANVTGNWTVKETAVPQAIPGEKMIFADSENAYFGLSTLFDEPLNTKGKTLVLQYETRFDKEMDCGGAYIKLFSGENFRPDSLCNETKYVIMFGPDKCGDTNKVHFIFRHKNPLTGQFEEKHMKDAPAMKNDKLAHLYTLIVRPDNSFEVLIDGESAKAGSLLTDFDPPVNPPKEIDDPTDVKPADWVDDEFIDDPNAVKPDDWDEDAPAYIPDPEKLEPPEDWLVDEPRFIPDPDAVMPDDWDEDMYGEWEAPTIPNPKCEDVGCGEYEPPLIDNPDYMGKWEPPRIENPAYKGEWKARQIPNPNYYEDPEPHNFQPIFGAGFELWIVNKDVAFGNVYIGDDEEAVKEWNRLHFIPKSRKQHEEDTKINQANDREDKKYKDPYQKREGYAGALIDFAENVKMAWMDLYKEDTRVTVVITAAVLFVPVAMVLSFLCSGCGGGNAEKQSHRKKVNKRRFDAVMKKGQEMFEKMKEEEEQRRAKKSQ